jgi:hypothetical protein
LSDYAVARAAADYGNKHGTSIFPGVERLAEDLGTTTKTVKASLAWLTEHGWLYLEERGNRRLGHANRYQLSVPAPLATSIVVEIPKDERVEGGPTHRWLWANPGRSQWIERPESEPKREAARGPYQRAAGAARAGRGAAIRGSNSAAGEVSAPDQGVITSPHPVMYPEDSLHPAERNARGHADARPRESTAPPKFDLDDPDVGQQIAAEAERRLGAGISDHNVREIEGMLADGCHPKFALNAAIARESRSTA